MHRFVPAPADLRPFFDGMVLLRSPAMLRMSCFPALVGSMLTVRLKGQVSVQREGEAQAVPAVALIGASRAPTEYLHDGEVQVAGLLVRPEAVPSLLQGSAATAVDSAVDLQQAWGGAGSDLLAQLHEAEDDEARLAALWQAMRVRLQGRVHLRRTQGLALLRQVVGQDLDAAPQRLGTSLRQLERRFAKDFGLGPKRFHRIVRMERTLRTALSRGVRGAELAVMHGFYDQSHMARELRLLAGHTLGALMAGVEDPQGRHWALDAGRQQASHPL